MSYVVNGVEYNLDVKELAKKTDYTEAHLRAKAKAGEIRSVRRGREYRFNYGQVCEDLSKPRIAQPLKEASDTLLKTSEESSTCEQSGHPDAEDDEDIIFPDRDDILKGV